MGLDAETWAFINSFSGWAGALGSIAAAWVALHIANRSSKPTADVRVGLRIMIGGELHKRNYVAFKIVNTGDRPMRINGIGWSIGLFKKRHAIQMHDESVSSPLPIELTHGQEATWLFPTDLDDEPWIRRFSEGMILPKFRIGFPKIRAQFFTSVGHVFEANPESGLIDRLREECKRLRNGASTKLTADQVKTKTNANR